MELQRNYRLSSDFVFTYSSVSEMFHAREGLIIKYGKYAQMKNEKAGILHLKNVTSPFSSGEIY